jgi:alkylhydroperoxidase family enzyme
MDKVLQLEHWRDCDLFDEHELAALEYAEAMTYSDQQVSPALIGRLKTLFGDDGVVELTGLIAFQNLSSKFNAALDVPAQGFCQIP